MRIPTIAELYDEEARNRTKVVLILVNFPGVEVAISPGDPILN